MPLCPRLLVCDLDGTLLNSQGTMSPATIAALRQAQSAGVEVAFATGRRHSFASHALAPAAIGRDTVVISSNGAVTRTFGGEHMRCIGMPAATALRLCRQLGRFRNSLIFTFERTGPGSLVVEDVEVLRGAIPRWVESNMHDIECIAPLERAFANGEEPIQAMICGTLAHMRDGLALLDEVSSEAADLRERLSIHRTEYEARDLCIVDLMAAQCSKGQALAELAALRGMDAAEIAAIGDNMNDVDMLGFAGHAVVMENAAPELLAMARRNGWTVTAGHNEDGAAQAILRMLEGTDPAAETAPAGKAFA